ncbi:MAG: hypothetical protein FD164_2329 [Nitrospirae bacterium]|nr:MAG: hypothetical protein FD164_2329 [Nitrospirota bacterium]
MSHGINRIIGDNINRFNDQPLSSPCFNAYAHSTLFPRLQLAGPNQSCIGASGCDYLIHNEHLFTCIPEGEHVLHNRPSNDAAEIMCALSRKYYGRCCTSKQRCENNQQNYRASRFHSLPRITKSIARRGNALIVFFHLHFGWPSWPFEAGIQEGSPNLGNTTF